MVLSPVCSVFSLFEVSTANLNPPGVIVEHIPLHLGFVKPA
jgi:hypothetical protein